MAANQGKRAKLKLHSVQLLARIDGYIRQYDIKGEWLPSAASDVLDGAVFKHEIQDLIRRRLLTVVNDCPPRRPKDECGESWTVHLTPRAINLFWKAREAHDAK
jgi:hypothetical protein